MTWISLILLGSAIALSWLSRTQTDEMLHFLQLSIALVFSLAGLLMAHWFVDLLILMGLIICPPCFPSDRHLLRANCSNACLLRRHCNPERSP